MSTVRLYQLTPEERALAAKLYADDIKHRRFGETQTIRGGKGCRVTRLGEMLALRIIGGVLRNTTDFDIELEDGERVDVKAKERNVPPRPHYNAFVSLESFQQQDCDTYLFFSVNGNDVWLCGWATKGEVGDWPTLRKGELEPGTSWRAEKDCHYAPYSECREVVPKRRPGVAPPRLREWLCRHCQEHYKMAAGDYCVFCAHMTSI